MFMSAPTKKDMAALNEHCTELDSLHVTMALSF